MTNFSKIFRKIFKKERFFRELTPKGEKSGV